MDYIDPEEREELFSWYEKCEQVITLVMSNTSDIIKATLVSKTGDCFMAFGDQKAYVLRDLKAMLDGNYNR